LAGSKVGRQGSPWCLFTTAWHVFWISATFELNIFVCEFVSVLMCESLCVLAVVCKKFALFESATEAAASAAETSWF